MTRERPEILLLGLAALVGALIAANAQISGTNLLGHSAYWITRLVIEAGMILGCMKLIDVYLPNLAKWQKAALSITVSLIPFVLFATALDIVLGLPELGLESTAAGGTRIKEFAWETLFLLDNHLWLGVLLALAAEALEQSAPPPETPTDVAPSLLTTLDPPLEGTILWVEAQEHYVRITTTQETRMVLNRFSDVVKTLPESDGRQVHRSHWVAHSAIVESYRDGANLRLKLTTGDSVPVSRSHRPAVEAALSGA